MMARRKNRFIVTTTINSPTRAIELYDEMPDWTLVVIGDKKTPPGYKLRNGAYLSPDDQLKLGFRTPAEVPWGCIQRRNVGFLYALREGAELIATIDDDNIPYDDWATDLLVGEEHVHVEGTQATADICLDPLWVSECEFDKQNVKQAWHRGFPPQLIDTRGEDTSRAAFSGALDVAVQAWLWDGDPDVDATYRMVNGPLEASFPDMKQPIIVAPGTYAPFNTQNTIFSREVAPCMALPYMIGRMDDIWAGFMTQRVMFELGKRLVFSRPSVYQERNPHDLSRDIDAEVIGYKHTIDLLKTLRSLDVKHGSVIGMYQQIVDAVAALPFMESRYKHFMDAWLHDIGEVW